MPEASLAGAAVKVVVVATALADWPKTADASARTAAATGSARKNQREDDRVLREADCKSKSLVDPSLTETEQGTAETERRGIVSAPKGNGCLVSLAGKFAGAKSVLDLCRETQCCGDADCAGGGFGAGFCEGSGAVPCGAPGCATEW